MGTWCTSRQPCLLLLVVFVAAVVAHTPGDTKCDQAPIVGQQIPGGGPLVTNENCRQFPPNSSAMVTSDTPNSAKVLFHIEPKYVKKAMFRVNYHMLSYGETANEIPYDVDENEYATVPQFCQDKRCELVVTGLLPNTQYEFWVIRYDNMRMLNVTEPMTTFTKKVPMTFRVEPYNSTCLRMYIHFNKDAPFPYRVEFLYYDYRLANNTELVFIDPKDVQRYKRQEQLEYDLCQGQINGFNADEEYKFVYRATYEGVYLYPENSDIIYKSIYTEHTDSERVHPLREDEQSPGKVYLEHYCNQWILNLTDYTEKNDFGSLDWQIKIEYKHDRESRPYVWKNLPVDPSAVQTLRISVTGFVTHPKEAEFRVMVKYPADGEPRWSQPSYSRLQKAEPRPCPPPPIPSDASFFQRAKWNLRNETLPWIASNVGLLILIFIAVIVLGMMVGCCIDCIVRKKDSLVYKGIYKRAPYRVVRRQQEQHEMLPMHGE